MQLASFTPPATANVNVHVLSTGMPDASGIYVVDTAEVRLDPANRDGGFIYRSTHMPGHTRMQATHVLGSDRERAAAQAVKDAIHASGLLALAQPRDHIGKPAHGLTRIYFDRRTSFVEYPTDRPTPAIQSVLDAVAAWKRLA